MAARVSRRSMAGAVAIAAEYGLRCAAVLAAPQYATEFTDTEIKRDTTGGDSGTVSRRGLQRPKARTSSSNPADWSSEVRSARYPEPDTETPA
jgi:hypothetical protein